MCIEHHDLQMYGLENSPPPPLVSHGRETQLLQLLLG